MMQKSKQLSQKILLLLIAVFLTISAFAAYTPAIVNSQSEAELRNNIDQIELQVANNQKTLEALEAKSADLQSKLSALQLEIDVANHKIELNELKIQELEKKLQETQKELERQKNLLQESLRELYKRGRISTLEMLASSDNFSDYLSQQEYLSDLKDGIQDSVDEVKKLEQEIKDEKIRQQDLLDQKKAARLALSDRKSEQAKLLEQTQGSQAKYERIVAGLEDQRAQAQKDLDDYMAAQAQNQNYVSLGRVHAGDTIGYIGSTGYSTGPHLHFEMRSGGSTIDPGGPGGLSYGFGWPTPGNTSLSQGYGCIADYDTYYNKCGGHRSFHSGIDISGWYGDPIVAPADGDIIFRGWFGGYGNMIMIKHDNGIVTAYGHTL